LNNNTWKDVSRIYREISKLGIIYPNLHSKVPFIVIKTLNRKEEWQSDSMNLTSILVGLTHREVLLKDERAALISIISFFDKKYG
jgi:hypothetical protein